MFVDKLSIVDGNLTKTCDVEFTCDTGADVSILTKTTSDVLDLQWQLKSG